MSNIINDKVLDYINGYYKPLSEALGELRNTAEENRVPIILKDTETFLTSMLALSKPKRILEIGTAVGYSAACFATAAPDAEIITIERSDEAYEEALRNIEKLGLSERITCLKGDACAILEELVKRYETGKICDFDFVFIDAGKSHYKEFLDLSMKLTKPGALIVCDNILMKAKTASDEYDPIGRYKTNIRRMREFVDYLMAKEELSSSLLPNGDGISLSIVK